MSRVGKVPVRIPQGVKVILNGALVNVEGPKGKLTHTLPVGVRVAIEQDVLTVDRDEAASTQAAALHGLTRTLIANMVHGVHTGFVRELDIVGVGYRAAMKGQVLNLLLGYSHPIDYEMPVGITARVDNNTHVVVMGADKMQVGMVASKIRSFREPEPYQGKGIKYSDEVIIRKQGKAAGSK